jgi:hypothetical protein
MKSTTELTCLSNISWNDILNNLHNGKDILPNFDNWNLNNPHYMKIYDQWKENNFNMQAVKWTNYYPEQFPKITEQISDIMGIQPLRSWISKIDPGYYAPWHFDVDEEEELYASKNADRYSCFISQPKLGHVTIIGDELFSNTATGTFIKWNDRLAWHTSMCACMSPNYMFHLIAYRK